VGDWHREEPLRLSWSAERREGKLSGRLTAFRSRTRVDSLLTGRADGAAGGIQGASAWGKADRWGGVCGLCCLCGAWGKRSTGSLLCGRTSQHSYGICISIFFRFRFPLRAVCRDPCPREA